ncbi:MAG: ABC transporter permease, partial [Geminicoccaceae bacterium]|nr:ABC transporter permease [Geminicoccaceae bacterium]
MRFPSDARDWTFAWGGAVAAWLVTVWLGGGQGGLATLVAALSFSAYFVLVAVGQMFVIASGPGNVDLSIPATVTLGGVIGMGTMAGGDLSIPLGLAAALAAGLAVGVANYGLIRALSIPPIIATLSSSFIVQSVAIWWGRGLRVKPPPALEAFAFAKPLGVPAPALLVLLLTLAAAVLLRRTVYGRTVLATGQNARAARLAGLGVERARFATYALSGCLAALTGVLFSAFSGGASLDMGAQFLLASIAVVVIGGT